ncbi:hypothetical protein MAR_009165 [Mya arenaria]|uniref:Uncharacterized protein n=1 Tax=Mya arenaria TaxID=6604 RepID=A0ABY7DXT1_MYAAR|nr:hypothetical protein MAR_009091 [Mya arenaria]WAR02607.1 hypothetical protein MAR_009165 [Mya arenaria]
MSAHEDWEMGVVKAIVTDTSHERPPDLNHTADSKNQQWPTHNMPDALWKLFSKKFLHGICE